MPRPEDPFLHPDTNAERQNPIKRPPLVRDPFSVPERDVPTDEGVQAEPEAVASSAAATIYAAPTEKAETLSRPAAQTVRQVRAETAPQPTALPEEAIAFSDELVTQVKGYVLPLHSAALQVIKDQGELFAARSSVDPKAAETQREVSERIRTKIELNPLYGMATESLRLAISGVKEDHAISDRAVAGALSRAFMRLNRPQPRR